jgi:hypothetical protein
MRCPWPLVVCLTLSACAGERLAQAPPTGVELSGKWHLDAAESDDPQRLVDALANSGNSGSAGGGQGGGGRRGRGGGGQSPSTAAMPGATGAPLSVSAVSEILEWPGRDLEIKQAAGVAAFTSDGQNRIYQPTGPSAPVKKSKHGGTQICGWSGSTLVVQVEPDDDRPQFEEQYALSADKDRLVQVVLIKSGRMNGFTLSRTWDRVDEGQ